MGIFAARTRRSSSFSPGPGVGLSDALRLQLPAGFEALGEALVSGVGSIPACEIVGRALGDEGVSLMEALERLQTTYSLVAQSEPGYAETQALAVAWSESTLGYLHQLSCEDPLTGLSSMAHLRSRIGDLFRSAGDEEPRDAYVLVVVDAPAQTPADRGGVLTETLRASRLGEGVRTVFPGVETVARVGAHRIVVIVRRDDRLMPRMRLLRRLLEGFDPEAGAGGTRVRVWLESFAPTDAGTATVIDELARS